MSPNLDDPEERKSIYKRIEAAGRTCYKSEDRIKEDSSGKFVRAMVKNGHEAMLEHASMTVRFIVDRGVSHELVRHRICSFAQESTRYCLAEDMTLTFLNPHVHMTIGDLYENRIQTKNGAWRRMLIKQYNEETGELKYSRIKDVFFNGIKPCITIETKLGYAITCTPNHEIYTPGGWIEAGNLKKGDKIYVNGTEKLYMNHDWLYMQNIILNKTFVEIASEFGFNISTIKNWARKLGIPRKGTGYFHIGRTPWNKGQIVKNQVEALRKYHHCGRRKEGIMKPDTVNYQKHMIDHCEICNCRRGLEVHHIDKDRMNNDPSNLITLCESCHQRVHSQNLEVAYADEIVSIENVGEKKVYDIEMNSEYHNFSANGVIVHNCNYANDKFGSEVTFIEPGFFSDLPEEVRQAIRNLKNGMPMLSYTGRLSDRCLQYGRWYDACRYAEGCYFDMLKLGASPQEARAVLPNSLKTEVVMTADMREWRNIFKLRAAGEHGAPHPQMLEVMVPLLKECKEKLPELFDDIGVIDNEN